MGVVEIEVDMVSALAEGVDVENIVDRENVAMSALAGATEVVLMIVPEIVDLACFVEEKSLGESFAVFESVRAV